MHGLIESQKQYVASVKDTVLLHDIVKRKPVRDVTLLDDTFIYLVNNNCYKSKTPVHYTTYIRSHVMCIVA